MDATEIIDPALALEASLHRQHAASLRRQADDLTDVLAASYRRRAAELELAAWALDARAGLRDAEVEDPVVAAAA